MAAQSKKDLSWQFYLLQLPFWSALVLLVIATLLVVAIRFLVPQADLLRPHLETWLEEHLPFDVEISHLNGSLFKINPAIGIEKLTLSKQGQDFLVIEDVYFELDTLASLIAVAPRMKDARLSGLELWLEKTPQNWQLSGWQQEVEVENKVTNKGAEDSLQQVMGYIELLLVQGELDFHDLRFNFDPLDDEPLFFTAESMSYRRWSNGRQFNFQLEASTATTQPAELVITLEGEGFDAKTSNLSAWFNFPLVSLNDFQGLWPAHLQKKLQSIQGQFSVEGWLKLNQGQVQLDLQARNVEIFRDELWQIEFDTADITLQGELHHWSADWKVSNLNASEYGFNTLAGRVGQKDKHSYLQLEALDLTSLAEHLKKDDHLPEALRELIKDLAPGGYLKNLLVTRDSLGEFKLQANLYDVKVDAWEGAPSGSGLYGWLQVDANGGEVVFSEHQLQLGFPELYSSAWNFSAAKGAVRWELEGEDLWVIGEDLAVVLPIDNTEANNVYVSGDFAYFYGPSDQRFYLALGLLPADVAAHHQLVPDKLVEPVLMEWLSSALLAGKVQQAGFIYAGSIKNKAAFQLVADFTATDFKFQPDWPHLSQAKGQVQVLDGWVKGQVAGANLGLSQLSQASFATTSVTKDVVNLEVTSDIQTNLEFFPWLVKNSPLRTQVPEPLHAWQYLGQMQGKINLDIPLSDTEIEPSVELASQISNAQLTLSQIDLVVTDINGPLNFTLDKGLESSGLIGKVMSQPVEAIFHIEPESYLSFTAGLAAEDMKKYFHLPEALDFTGITKVQGTMPLAPFGVLEVKSNLQGLALATPLPWQKEAPEKREFNMQLDFSDEQLPLRLQLADQLDFLMHLDKPSRGSRLHLAEKKVTQALLPEEPGLVASINMDHLDAEQIYTWYNQFNLNNAPITTSHAPVDSLQGLNAFNINIGQLNWGDFELGQTDFSLFNLDEALKLTFITALTAGEVWWPASSEQPPEILLSYLHLPAQLTNTQQLASELLENEDEQVIKRSLPLQTNDWLVNFDPRLVPATLIEVQDLRQGEKRFGHLKTQVVPFENGLNLDPLLIDLEESHLVATLEWFTTSQGPTSRITGTLAGKNLEPALKALTVEKDAPIVSNKHLLTFTSDWQGSPVGFNLQKAKAEFKLKLEDGYFPKTDLGLNGISQIFGLLNMDTLLRRLRLDFSDLTAKGVSYNSIKGVYQLEDGYLRTTEPTKIISSATRMTLTGELDLIEETLEQELTIVLPVAQSLPLAAVLVGAPQVGAVIWVAQKVFSNLFDAFTEVRYKINGSLDNPQIELQRVF